MKSDDRHKLLLSDTAIPDLFISEYMHALTGVAVQAYLYILMVAGKGNNIKEREITSRLSLSLEDAKGALAELTLAGLIDRNERGELIIADIKAEEVDRYIQRTSREEAKENEPISPLNEAREELARSIEKTFFHGSMAYKWYREIDILLFDFGFDPDVVYALFQSLYESNRLTVVTRMKEKAVEWHGKGIRTAKDLGTYLSREEEVATTLRKIGKRLRKKMTGFDEDYVRIWIEKLGYPYDMIEYAMQKVCEYSTNPSLKRANEHMLAWFRADVKTLDAAKAYEEEQARINAARYQNDKASKSSAAKASKQNFSGVTYTDEELRQFEDDPQELLERYAREKADPAPR
ncbi:MAG: DnaD domain protein [Clostridiales bacterium]|nr:DnaD domain protein [Clostridiales bacterium]